MCWLLLGSLGIILVREAGVAPEEAGVHERLSFAETSNVAHGSAIWALAVSPRDGRTAAAGWSGEVWLKEAATNPGTILRRGEAGSARSMAFDPEGRTLVIAGDGPGVVLYDVLSPESPTRLFAEGRPFDDRIAFSLDGRLLAVGGADGSILIGDWKARRPVAVLGGGGARVAGLGFSPDGSTLAELDTTGMLRIWNVRERIVVGSIRAHETGVGLSGAGFSPDGRLVATTALLERSFRIWNVADGSRLGGLEDMRAGAVSSAFSPDGSLVALAHIDGTLTIWSVAENRPKGRLRANGRGVRTVVFVDGGRSLVTGGNDGFVRVWDVKRALERGADGPDGTP